MKEFVFGSKDITDDVINAGDQREPFALIVNGKRALKLFKMEPRYAHLREVSRHRERARIFYILPLAWNSPRFWGACTLADAKARDSMFIYENNVLRVEFYF